MESENQQPQKSREELFKENPDNFIHTNDVIIAFVRSEKGIGIFFNPRNRGEMVRALGEIQVKLLEEIFNVDIAIAQAKNKIVSVKGSIINRVRGAFGK